ncbi:hypothetical protein MC885_008960 [Smutsia gigantea]|nr:hypothetical protein MC885_008960 [Smutsia gigantea]
MDQHSVEEEGALPSKMHLPSFYESEGLNCNNALNQDLGPNSHLLHAGLNGLDLDPSLLAPNVPSKVLEDNVDAFFLYSTKDSDSMKVLEEYADPESQASLQGFLQKINSIFVLALFMIFLDLELGALTGPREADEGGRATSRSARRGRRQHSSPQNSRLDCSLCGKMFRNTSSLKKHYLSHSQERNHVCVTCSKAFKRKDHLNGHMLTHQKTKPFVCNEQGCSKSYCRYRSLRRHYEAQHGLCTRKEAPLEKEACADSPHAHEVASQPAAGGRRSLVPPEARSPGSLLPDGDLLPCIMGSTVHQKISSPGPILARPSDDRKGENTACPCPPSLGPYASTPVAPETLGTDVPKECHPAWKESARMFSGAVENGGPDTAESERLLQLPSTLESWQEGRTLPACLPLLQCQTAPASSQPSNHSFQQLRDLPGCPKSKGNNVSVIHKPTSVSPQEGSESGPRPSSTSLMGEPLPSSDTSLEDTLPLPRTHLKAPGEASGDPRYAGEEEDSWAFKNRKFDCDSCSRQHLGDPSLQEAPKPSSLSPAAMPLFRQLFLKSQESLAQCFSAFRKENVKMDTCCAASPSQVAVASFSSPGPSVDPPPDSKTKLKIFNRIQHPHPVKEENMTGGCNQQNGGPADWAEPMSTHVCKHCRQVFNTQKRLNSNVCFNNDESLSPRGKQDQQVFGMEVYKPLRQVLKPEVEGQSSPGARISTDSMSTAPLGTPVTVPVGPVSRPRRSKAKGQDRDKKTNSKENSQPRKRKRRSQPKALFMPPVPSAFGGLGTKGGHQSCLRSPVLLVDHLLKGLEIRIGSQFQAEIPELQERSLAGSEEHGASLVWKPWGDVMSNPETQDRVTELCNVACSSVMSGGGTNLELALHCLHDAQGNVQEALETLLLRGAQKPQTHPLADYHYTGSDIWTPMEKSLFEKAFCAHKNNFYLIHKMIQTKTVAQCVENYYLWKKRIRFNCGRAPGLKKGIKRKLGETGRTETKATCSPQKRPNHHPTAEIKRTTKNCRRESVLNSSPNAAPKQTTEPLGSLKGQGIFPCTECERVFDKINSRNAHMKQHQLQDPMEPIVRVKWPVKPCEQKEKEEEEAEEIGADMGPLQ